MKSAGRPIFVVVTQLARASLLVLTFCTIAGCGSGLANVSGVVTLDGQPLHGGSGDTRVTVQFQPASGTGTTAIGLADENGAYTLSTGSKSGLPPGDYVVSCSASQLVQSRNPKEPAGGRRITDPKYADGKTSGLRFTVQPGSNKFDIPLTSPLKTPGR